MKINLIIIFLIIFSRFFAFNLSPSSPYWEEVALGYDAYSIAETARDHHGNFLPLTAFESFGDYKPSLYFYTAVPFVKIFGLNTFAVRLPTVLASIAIIFGTALLAKNLFIKFYVKNDQKNANFIYYLTLFLTSVSPWLMMFSRSAWESTLATALIIWGINFYLFFIFSNKIKWIVWASITLVLSTYAYHSARVTAPLVGLFLTIFYLISRLLKKEKLNWRALLMALLIALLLFAPVGKSLFLKTGQQRIAETSIFNDISIIEQSNEAIENHGRNKLNKIIYHRYLFFAKEAGLNFLNHFNFKYLFISGDNNPRHSLQNFGEFYYLDLLFFVFAIFFLFKKRSVATAILCFILFVAILPASFTKDTPHALRTLTALPILIIFLSFGIWQFLELFKNNQTKKFITKIIILIYLVFFALFFYQLIYIYPNKYKPEWQFGYQEMIGKLNKIENNYETIYITREQGRPAMYYFFYTKVNPLLVQNANQLAKKDQGEFLEFQKIKFIDKPEQIDFSKKALIISSLNFYQNSFSKDSVPLIDKTDGETWVFYEIN
jgi:4-amino-4-deoxy-L-arabinose transferase-like glycosyltransferase